MILPPPISTRTGPLFPYTTLFRAQVFAAPQIHVAPPRPLPDTPGTEPMFSGMGYVDPESAPDIPYSFFWQEEDTNAWRRRHVYDASPGLRGERGWHRPSRRLRSPWLARQNDPEIGRASGSGRVLQYV